MTPDPAVPASRVRLPEGNGGKRRVGGRTGILLLLLLAAAGCATAPAPEVHSVRPEPGEPVRVLERRRGIPPADPDPSSLDALESEEPVLEEDSAPEPVRERGVASYYANRFHGRRTASGERFDMYDLTAAHRDLPFGTRVRVVNVQNGRSVIVRINDRGPFVRGRTIDLSYRAAEILDFIRDGLAEVVLEILP